ncbi:DUF262 domain-containing protein [Dietzia maris]
MTIDAPADGLKKLSVKDVFADDRYRVPLYQRAYAWTMTEIHTLLIDIQDARKNSLRNGTDPDPRKYYIGSLVVNTLRSEDDVVHEVVDGQQRLTTLFVMLSVAPEVLGHPQAWSHLLEDKLSFEGRSDARDDLLRLARRGPSAINSLRTDGIKNAAEIIQAAALRGASTDVGAGAAPAADHRAAEDPSFTVEDLEYLLEHVMILRTDLPPGTDLNHYFEVMNTRGEQLEKHEILKARLIAALDSPAERATFSQIWDACAILDRHLQTQFSTSKTDGVTERARIFGSEWDTLVPRNGRELFDALAEQRRGENQADLVDANVDRISLAEVLETGTPPQSGETTDEAIDESGSYGAIVDFPNLLLHALKIFRREEFSWAVDIDFRPGEVRLEDKYLLEEFALRHPDSPGQRHAFDTDRVREFAFVLFKSRYLLDTYVIRTQTNTAGDHEENWVLHRAFRRPAKGKQSQQLSARNTFRVADSDSDADGSEAAVHRQVLLLQAMFQVSDTRRSSKYFLFQMLQWLHFQDQSSPVRGSQFVALLESSARDRLAVLYSPDNVNLGTLVQNFLFNVLDYELWRLAADQGRMGRLLGSATEVGRLSGEVLRRDAPQFRFRYRTSVEHFYPSQPATEEGHEQLPGEVVDQFGNLCIMSRSENSRRNNLMPKAKAEQFASQGQSLKFQLMAEIATKGEWGRSQIASHGEMMMQILEDVIDSRSAG